MTVLTAVQLSFPVRTNIENKVQFSEYLNGLAALAISAVAAALSSTILREQLIPVQVSWLGSAGTVVAAVFVIVGFLLREIFRRGRVRNLLLGVMLLSLGIVLWLRAAAVLRTEIQGVTANYLIGVHLPRSAAKTLEQCPGADIAQKLDCAGEAEIPEVYGGFYSLAYYGYTISYLVLLASYVLLVSTIQLQEKADTVER